MRRISLTCLLLSAATACTSLRPTVDPSESLAGDLPATYSRALPAQDRQVTMPAEWWRIFESEELDSLMDAAFTGNLTLAQAWTRLQQAEAQAVRIDAARELQLSGQAAARRSETRRTADGSPAARTGENFFSSSLNAAYEVDIWGRLKAETESALAEVEATRQDALATALVLSGQVARTWIDLQTAEHQLALVRSQLETSRQLLELLELRQRKGISAAADVFQQRQNVASTEALIPLFKETAELLENQLCLLLGTVPSDLPEAAGDLPATPPLPETGVPANLLTRRPDIEAAWARVQAGEWNVYAAKADRLPALTLTGSAGLGHEKVRELFDNWALNLAAGLAGPILDGGRRAAEVDRTQAVLQQRLLAYTESVLQAIREVEDGLVVNRYGAEYLDRTLEELRYAEATLEETQRRYRKGVTDYLPVLTALNSKQRLEREAVNARAGVLKDRVDLCEALGGDWMNQLDADASKN